VTTALLLIALGVILGIGSLIAYAVAADSLDRRNQAIRYAQAQQRRSEARIQQITQDAVQQMLDAARHGPR
jgi:F0F1-type ATP synthase membrane subunit b/b'